MYMGEGCPSFQIRDTSLVASVAVLARISTCSSKRGYLMTNSSNHRSRISFETFALKKTKKSLLVAYKPNKNEMRQSTLSMRRICCLACTRSRAAKQSPECCEPQS